MMFLQISNFTPEGVQESLSTSVTGFFEAGAERVLIFPGLNSSCSYYDRVDAVCFFYHKECTLISSLEILNFVLKLNHRIDELTICIWYMCSLQHLSCRLLWD